MVFQSKTQSAPLRGTWLAQSAAHATRVVGSSFTLGRADSNKQKRYSLICIRKSNCVFQKLLHKKWWISKLLFVVSNYYKNKDFFPMRTRWCWQHPVENFCFRFCTDSLLICSWGAKTLSWGCWELLFPPPFFYQTNFKYFSFSRINQKDFKDRKTQCSSHSPLKSETGF